MFLDALAGPAAGAARRKAVRKAAGRKRLKEATFGETQTPKGHRPNASAAGIKLARMRFETKRSKVRATVGSGCFTKWEVTSVPPPKICLSVARRDVVRR